MRDLTLDLDDLERIANAASSGPWRAVEDPEGWWTVYDGYGEPIACARDIEDVLEPDDTEEHEVPLRAEDAKHFAAFDAPTCLALIARIRELERRAGGG